MLTVEVLALREDELRVKVQEAMPEGLVFDVAQSPESRLWVATFRNDKGEVQWEIADITLKQVLLHTLGWLEVRDRQVGDSRWVRRSGDLHQRAHEKAYRAFSTEGPQDLEPEEISSVYSSPRRGGK